MKHEYLYEIYLIITLMMMLQMKFIELLTKEKNLLRLCLSFIGMI